MAGERGGGNIFIKSTPSVSLLYKRRGKNKGEERQPLLDNQVI
jgi:hypothetical protein